MTSALEALIFNHWTAREVPEIVFKDVCIWEGQVGYGKEGKGWTPSNSSFGLNYTPRDKFAKISVLDKVYSDELMMVFIAPKWNYSHFKHLWKSVKILTFLPGLWHTAVQRSKLVWGEWPVCFLSRERFQGNRAQLIIQNNGIWVKLNSCVYKLFSWVFWLMMSSFTENHVTTCPGMNIPGLTSGSINNWLEGFIWVTGPLCGSPSSQVVRAPAFQRTRLRAELMGYGQCLGPTKQ